MTPRLGHKFFFGPTNTLSMNDQITLFSYYVELSATLCEQLRTIIHKVMHLFYDCSKLQGQGIDMTARITSQSSKKPSRY